MPNKKPYVQVASVCERVLQEPDGVITPVRLIDVLTLSQVKVSTPAAGNLEAQQVSIVEVMDLSLIVSLKSGDVTGDHKFSLTMHDPKGQIVPIGTDYPVVLKGNDGVNFKMKFGLPMNAPEGLYWFAVLWDGDELTRFPLRLKREVAAETADEAKLH